MRRADVKSIVIERTVSLAGKRVEDTELDAVARFIRLYYEHAGPEDVIGFEPSDLYGAALAHYRLAQSREPGTAACRVYTPRAANHGWQSTHTAVEVVIEDMPFIVDSVHVELTRHGLGIHRLIHPVVDGVSYVHVEVDRQTDPADNAQVERDLLRVLDDVRAAVEDRDAMGVARQTVTTALRTNPPPIDAGELGEIETFLAWLTEEHFTFLGYREYDLVSRDGVDTLVQVPGTGLGILRQSEGAAESGAFTRLPLGIRHLARRPYPLVLTKANTVATVHRALYLDYVGVKRFDQSGTVIGECRFLGLYTQRFYNSSPTTIPLLRRKLHRIIERAGLPAGGHAERDLAAVLEGHPRDELLQANEDELYDSALGILHLQERQLVRLFVRRDVYQRFFSCLVYLPRDRFNTNTRMELQRLLLSALHGEHIKHEIRLSSSVLARLHFVVYVDPVAQPALDVDQLEQQLARAVRSWADDLRDRLVDEHGEERGLALYRRYREAFGPAYTTDNLPQVAVDDIARLEALGADGIGTHLYRPLEVVPSVARFKLYRSGRPLLLSDVLPSLEAFGVRVADQRPHLVRPDGCRPVWIYDFGLQCDKLGDLDQIAALFQEAFAKSWRGEVETDGFNRLVLLARLHWRDITVLRAYAKYLRQIGTRFSPVYVESAVAAHPEIAALLVELFHTRFDPATTESDRKRRAVALTNRIEAALDEVTSLDQDRILRSVHTLVQATVRTNFFQVVQSAPKTHLSFKLDPGRIPNLPLPRPAHEVFVYAPHVEGVHLRGGLVARGGIRWSDRREDFRTEILGLMKAQIVKNTVIVPAGAKGGFVVKNPPHGRDELAAEIERCYRTFISGLLDLTDNRQGTEVSKIIAPPNVVRYDGEDPYLVVAADKGTANLSDVANQIAREYGYWLGDAFASGGSAGYDHKKMGITARGAWESVKRHFRERGVDVVSTPVTVIGIGDMSGDVFGNGMLLSRHLKLVGAFDHRHVFLDPDPDPEISYGERKRLFEMPGSTWDDYDRAALSPGGGVFRRTAKSITLTPRVRAVLGIDPATTALTPNDLIRCLLRAPVDLLWNGGVGTYVKASGETHAEVGDKTNDLLRVDASEMRCRVVGEGGNLGLTQRARVELARAGTGVYTDAIDNSAGVDCSDHEVNIKILLDPVVAAGDLTIKQRDVLLAEMTDEVAALVLADNERQTQALANAVARGPSFVDLHAQYTRWLVHKGGLDRGLEFLPTEEEFAQRKSSNDGLTAPEFAVLLAYTKNLLQQQLIATTLPDDPFLTSELVRYFPAALRGRFAREIERHRLRREIVATSLVSSMVDRQGITFVYRLADVTGARPVDIASAFAVAREVFDMASLWSDVRALDNRVPAAVQTRLLLAGRTLVERATRWLLRHAPAPIDISATVTRLAKGAQTVAELLPEILSEDGKQAHQAFADELISDGVPTELAAQVAAFEDLLSALDIVDVAHATDRSVEVVAETYFALENRLRFRCLRSRINELSEDNRWQVLARLTLRDDLYLQLRAITAEALALDRVQTWLDRKASAIARCQQVIDDIQAGGTFDFVTLSVALGETNAVVGT